MSTILNLLKGLIPGNLTSFLSGNLLSIGLGVFALALGFFAILYLGKRQTMQNQEKMAAVIKGLHYAGVSHDIFNTSKTDARQHLFSGLQWLFGAAGVSGAMYSYARLQPAALSDIWSAIRAALIGIIPGMIGLAHLLFSWLCSRQSQMASPTVAGSPYVRAGVRRYRPRR